MNAPHDRRKLSIVNGVTMTTYHETETAMRTTGDHPPVDRLRLIAHLDRRIRYCANPQNDPLSAAEVLTQTRDLIASGSLAVDRPVMLGACPCHARTIVDPTDS